MISKVHRPTQFGGPEQQPKSTFLGRQWEAGGSGYLQNRCFFMAAFFWFGSVLDKTRALTPGFTPLKISQDFAHLRAPRPFSHNFDP